MVYAGSLMFLPPNHPVNLCDFSQWWTFAKGARNGGIPTVRGGMGICSTIKG